MTVFPTAIDDDRSIIRIDDNLSEMGGTSINQIREAIFAIERTLGLNLQGSMGSLAERLNVSINSDGTLRTDALQAVGLATLPIHDNQVAATAGIQESKLDLDFSTSDLATQLAALDALVNSTADLATLTNADLLIHIAGGTLLNDNSTQARHVASQIDINNVPLDTRDGTYIWGGLKDKNGNLRSATQVAEALLQINDDFVAHQNAISEAHVATAISVDTTNFLEIPKELTDVQAVFDYFDDQETLSTGLDRATLHTNGIIRDVRAEDPRVAVDGYNTSIVPETKVAAYLAEPSQTAPNDNASNGDDVIQFFPEDNSKFTFDAQFSQVKVGDTLRINYGMGIEAVFPIKSIRFKPGTEWAVRISTYNLKNLDGYNGTDGYDGYARIDKSRFDNNTWGVFAAAGAVPNTNPGGACDIQPQSVIIGNPKGATALGIGFDPGKLDIDHYKLYLRLYPSGDPEVFTDLPFIDVTGNAGTTPGAYNIDRVVEATNAEFRKAGYNYRFIAFNYKGEFGLMLADAYNNASFSIIAGQINGTSIEEASFTENAIGDATDGYDGLGLGAGRAGFATPVLPSGSDFTDAQAAASLSTLVIPPVTGRDSIIDGARQDILGTPSLTQGDGYWIGTVTDVTTNIIENTKTVTYTVPLDLSAQELAVGKTIVIQPTDPTNADIAGYGRFIIGNVTYDDNCGTVNQTIISVINGIHGTGDPLGTTLPLNTEVKLYFSEDSVGFNNTNVVGDTADYFRYHEIFATPTRETFAVERARMPKQTETGILLGTLTENWRIRKVSPKLKGVRTGSDFRSFVRFVVTDYDPATGRYDGYIGEPDGDSILNPGPIVSGKKDRTVRFYDGTYVSHIDIEFREFSTTPGVNIMPDTSPRYVDIEVFDTLQRHDEFFVLAGVSHNVLDFQSITDLREFGTLSEDNFTDSAIKFIQAGERYLHANGVVRGFEYEGTATNSEAVLGFTGGIALVNGAFVATDSFEVKLPEVKSSSSDEVNFLICVTEGGQLQAVVQETGTGAQFYAVDTGYYVETLSFRDVVNKHKKLTIVAKVNATIADQDGGGTTYSLNSVVDARRFVYNESVRGPWSLTVSPEEDGYVATFRSAEAVTCWVNEYDISEVKIVYLETNECIDLSGMNNKVRFYGGNALINSDVGVMIGNNVHLDGIDFIYNPNQAEIVDNNLHLNTDFGCVYSEDYENMKVTNCTFISTVECPPAIHFKPTSSNDLVAIEVSNNRFNLSSNVQNCAIAFTKRGSVTDELSLNSVIVSGNTCEGSQAIVISVDANVFDGDSIDSDPFVTNNVSITRNQCGAIGFLTSEAGQNHTALQISENDALIITTMDGGGNQIDIDDFDIPDETGAVTIDRNKCYSIGVTIDNTSASSYINITNNNIVSGSSSVFPGGYNNTYGSIGIYVCSPYIGTVSGAQVSNVKIIGNSIYQIPELGRTYDGGIELHKAGIIANNSIGALASDAVGIRLVGVDTNDDNDSRREISVHNNAINRGSVAIDAFISIDAVVDDPTFYKIVDNYFDSRYIDLLNTDDDTIKISNNPKSLIDRNINHLQTTNYHLTPYFGPRKTSSSGAMVYNRFFDQPQVDNVRGVVYNASGLTVELDTGGTSDLIGVIPLNTVLPPGAKLVKISQGGLGLDIIAGELSISVFGTLSGLIDSDTQDLSVFAGGTLELDAPSTTRSVEAEQYRLVIVLDDIKPDAGGGSWVFTFSTITYTW